MKHVVSEHKFNHRIAVQIRFNDIDILGHVNNSTYLTFYDLGKTSYFEKVNGKTIDWTKSDIVVANINTDFFSAILPNQKIAVQTKVLKIGNKSLQLLQEIIDENNNEVKSRCLSIMVGFDPKSNTSKEIPESWKEAFRKFEGDIE